MENVRAQEHYPLPTNEVDRLQALRSYCVLDSPQEAAFDELTALASATFKAPIVLISLVDEHRQVFKSAVGLSIKETPRNVSFCSYAILQDKPLVVLDAMADDRFRDNPFVMREPHFRFYAGAPLIDSNGFALGSFCVIDVRARSAFSTGEQEILERLARLTAMLIQQRLFTLQRAEQQVLVMNERYQLATQATTEGIWDWNCQTDELFQTARMCAIVGLAARDGHTVMNEWLRRVHPLDAPELRANIEALWHSSIRSFQFEYRVLHEQGGWRWVRSRAIAVRDAEQKLIRVVGSLADVTAEKRTDPITGENTRSSLLEALDRCFKRPQHLARRFALIVLEFVEIRRISTLEGNSEAQVLIDLIARIKDTLSTEQTDLVARLSGDKIAVLVDYVATKEDAIMYAELLQAVLQAPLLVSGQPISFVTNVGIAVAEQPFPSSEKFLQQACIAAQASRELDNRCILFSVTLLDKAVRKLMLTADLCKAIETGSLSMQYQPKVDLATQQLIGFEALCRWSHPSLGSIAPTEFISIAEEGELILPLGRWTLRESIRQMSQWRSDGIVSSSAVIAVNLSAKQLREASLIDDLQRILTLHRYPPECLTLEVTEGVLIVDAAATAKTLGELKALGIGLDLDDFGTGYSALSYLRDLPFDNLKIDQSFVRRMNQESGPATLVPSMIALAHAMKLGVIAEGIETEEQLRSLCEMGCDNGQGYLFSRPLQAADVPGYLQREMDSRVLARISREWSLLGYWRPLCGRLIRTIARAVQTRAAFCLHLANAR